MTKDTIIFLFVSCLANLCSPTQAQAAGITDLFRNAKNSVVLIVAEDANQAPLAIGSGFFFRKNLIATNYHVVEDAVSFKIKVVGSDSKINAARVRSYSEALDLAILETDDDGTPLPLVASENVEVGFKVMTIGNPRGLAGSVSEGIVSGIREVESIRIFQITAAISPGSSGGPVLLESGKVLGIATFSLTESQNLNFAMPASLLLELEQKHMKWEPAKKMNPVYEKGNAGVELVFFKKDGAEFEETFSLKNTTRNTIMGITVLFIYKTKSGDFFDFRLAKINETIPPGLAKMVTQRSFDKRQKFSYVKGKDPYKSHYDQFDIELRILSYDIVEQEGTIGDKLLDNKH